jgi:hypothetical protein
LNYSQLIFLLVLYSLQPTHRLQKLCTAGKPRKHVRYLHLGGHQALEGVIGSDEGRCQAASAAAGVRGGEKGEAAEERQTIGATPSTLPLLCCGVRTGEFDSEGVVMIYIFKNHAISE